MPGNCKATTLLRYAKLVLENPKLQPSAGWNALKKIPHIKIPGKGNHHAFCHCLILLPLFVSITHQKRREKKNLPNHVCLLQCPEQPGAAKIGKECYKKNIPGQIKSARYTGSV